MRKVLYILSRLSDDDVEWLAAAGVSRSVPAGTELIRQGEPAEALIFVLDGEVTVTVEGIGEVARLGSGEILGEMSFVDHSPPSGTVTTSAPSRLLVVDRNLMTAQLDRDPAFAARFYRAVSMFLSVRLRATMRRFGRAEAGPEDELSLEMLETVHVAGARFDRMIKRLLGV
jgi:CRP/FNR family transcriptional regulator, cyclic AMP receptor protein